MKRFILAIVLVFISTLIFGSIPACATTQDFTINDFQADYYLSKGDDGRSFLKTVEKITAEFPNIDQNHGIERAIPLFYDNHPVSLYVVSVVDEEGVKLPYSTRKSNDNLVLRIGDAEKFVHGLKTYVITYSQQDVTKYYQDTKSDEFYWDVNGLYWKQPFKKVTARVHLGQDLKKTLNGNMSCYYGAEGSNQKCEIGESQDYISAIVDDLKAGENMTIAIGFQSGTFSPYKFSLSEWLKANIFIVALILNVLSILVIIITRSVKCKHYPSRGSISPQYLPPTGVNTITASVVSNNTSKWMASMFTDLAVRHNIRIVQESKQVIGFETKKYKLEFLNSNGLDETETNVINSLFGSDPVAGSQYLIEDMGRDYKLNRKLRAVFKEVDQATMSNGYYDIDIHKTLKRRLYVLGITVPVITVIIWALFASSLSYGDIEYLMPISFVSLIINLVIIMTIRPMSQKGRELYDYLKGLKMYIKLAESERLKVLQSVEGAQKTELEGGSNTQLVHLYERVLPYAVMFGLEKSWAKVLGEFYENNNSRPDWYAGVGAFNAANFSSAMSSFSSYTSSSSSSAGGSSGGGSSGGGGGGGGGGGW